MLLFCYYLPRTMVGTEHYANDDCALCRAWTKKQAIRKFQKMYNSVDKSNVFRVRYNSYGVAILSDY